jgi:hydroxymethylbilane synthase
MVEPAKLTLNGMVASVDGRKVVKGRVEGTPEKSENLGRQLAEELLAKGAADILREVHRKG